MGIDSNSFTGGVSPCVGTLTQLTYFSVGDNNMTGDVPWEPGLCEIDVLGGINLEGNSFTGEINPCVANLPLSQGDGLNLGKSSNDFLKLCLRL